MSGRIYDFCSFYVCNDCKSFDVASSREHNFNGPYCKKCGSYKVSPNDIFNNHIDVPKKKAEKIYDKNGNLILEGIFSKFDDKEGYRKKREKLMKIYGNSLISYNRNNNIDKILKNE